MVHQLTLLTGDRLQVQTLEEGRLAITVEAAPRAGDWPVVFVTEGYGDRELLIPSDALPLVHAGVLDPALFDLRYLLKQGYSDAQAAGLPLIISMEPAAGTERLRSVMANWPGTTGLRALRSVDGGALALNREASAGFWRALTEPGEGRLERHGISRIWLDRRVRMHLDQSAWIAGAPQVRDQYGLTGAGVRVAVIDSGIDAGHPDLAGRVVASMDFTGMADVNDVLGHGTHVAGIIAGDGTASDGQYTGIAPGVELLNAKVIDDQGEGLASWVIAAMEWAAAEARIVNLSVGGDPTDGTDPISMALNRLAKENDVLFVASAGNDGTDGAETIGTPGSADHAFTVGSVDKLDALAATSSRGPRLGNLAPKPDVVAPGVAIVAARAAGTAAGTPVDANYTRLSGTSMATPHVAGGAALLLENQPELTAVELKSLLVAYALPLEDLTVYQQGSGRLRILEALEGPLSVTPAPASLGYFAYPQSDMPSIMPLRMHNRSAGQLKVHMELEVINELGSPAPPEMLAVTPSTVVLDVGQTTSVNLTLSPLQGESGLYGGHLLASMDGEVLARVPVGFYKEPQMFELRIEGIRRNGQPAAGDRSLSGIQVINVDDARRFSSAEFFEDGQVSVVVPPGRYSAAGFVNSYHPELEDIGFYFATEWVFVSLPEFDILDHTHIVLDAREANEITIMIEGEDVEPVDNFYRLQWWRAPIVGESIIGGLSGIVSLPDSRLRQFALETAEVSSGEFELLSHARLARTGPEDETTAELYDLVLIEQGKVPSNLSYVLRPGDLARIDVQFHGHELAQQIKEMRHFWRPWQQVSVNADRDVIAPLIRNDYLTGGDTRYQQLVDLAGVSISVGPGRMASTLRFYDNRRHYSESWFRQPARPGPRPPESASQPLQRQGLALTVDLVEWTDAQRGHFGTATNADNVTFRLFQEDEPILTAGEPRGTFTLNTTWGEYRMELDVTRSAPWWSRSVSTHTAWTVRPPDVPVTPTPTERMIFVTYGLDDLNLLNEADPWLSRIRIQPYTVPGPVAVTPTIIRLWTSYDDGLNWQERTVISSGRDGYTFALEQIRPPEARGFVDLRVEVEDEHGNRLEQRIMRAYALPDPPP